MRIMRQPDLDAGGTVVTSDLDFDGTDNTGSGGMDNDLFLESYDANAGLRGTGRVSSPTVASRLGYAGYEWDDVLKADHVRHRVYFPDIGRWSRRDPVGYVDGMNAYQYVDGQAIGFLDAFGVCSNPPWYEMQPDDMMINPMIGGPLFVYQLVTSDLCQRLAIHVTRFLDTKEEAHAWIHYMAGDTSDVYLTPSDVSKLTLNCPSALAAIAMDGALCRAGPGWARRCRTVGNCLPVAPWVKSIGAYNLQICTSCSGGVLVYQSTLRDPYDFSPLWARWRSKLSNVKTIAVAMTRLYFMCGWRPFKHRGSTIGVW